MTSSWTSEARFQWSSDQSLLVYFDQQISLEVNNQVVSLLRLLEDKPVVGIRNLNPAYCSLLVTFDALRLQHSELEAILREYLSRLGAVDLPEHRQVDIPVCYGGELGPDLEDVAALHQLAPSQVIELHTSCTYTVYFLGFVPGFAYLGGLPESLATPRLRNSAHTSATGKCGNWRQPNRNISIRDTRWVAAAGTNSPLHVSSRSSANEPAVHRRSRAIYADHN